VGFGTNKNQFGVSFRDVQSAETVTLGPAGIAALGEQGTLPWEFLNPPGASDELTGMEPEKRFNYGIYADKFALTRLNILRQIESRHSCQ
jgi:hypothetical protein